ncbi:MAG: secretin and TonB N-terminal domain-containing protein, partial [Elusimicrobia bacterium]|nr:secretin and TonB N-terminal domain-containing protein [Elusimicrobiota bacterium]
MKNEKLKIKNWVLCILSLLLATRYSLLATTQLKDITVKSDEKQDSISVMVSSKTKFNIFRVDKPNRLVIDLIDCEATKKDFKDATQFITKIRAAQYKDAPVKKARIVIDLNKSVRFSAKSSDTEILVVLTKKQSEVRSPKSEVKKSTTTAIIEIKKSTITAVAPIKPKPKKKPTPPVVVKSITTTTISKTTAVEPPSISTPTAKPQEVVKSTETIKPEVATKPVAAKRSFAQPNIPDKKHLATVKEIKEKEKPEVGSRKSEVKKQETATTKEKQETAKTGTLPKDSVTLDFTDADIKDVLQILAVKTGMNIIYSDDVTGTLSLHLENVPFDEAMNLILQMKGLVLQQVASNVLRVMTPQTLSKERSDSVQVTQIYRLSYSKAADMASKITSIMTAESQKVTIQTDERTNSIIVTSTPEGLLAAAALINKLDVRPEQVLIEAKIVEISVGDTKDIGINWTLNRTVMGHTDSQITEDAQSLTPSQSAIGSFTYGYLRSDVELTARLAAAQTKGNARILSQPRIATLNNMEAKIVVGGQIPYSQTTIGAGGVST